MKTARLILTTLSLLLFPAVSVSFADTIGPSSFYITVAPDRKHYARCIPEKPDNQSEAGKTLVFLATPTGDKLIHEFDWYSPNIFIGYRASIVRLGPLYRGKAASPDHLAISFYDQAGKLLKRYSTLDLAGRPENVSASTSRYTVIKETVGLVSVYEKAQGNAQPKHVGFGFEIVLQNDERWVFDTLTGSRLQISADMFTQRWVY